MVVWEQRGSCRELVVVEGGGRRRHEGIRSAFRRWVITDESAGNNRAELHAGRLALSQEPHSFLFKSPVAWNHPAANLLFSRFFETFWLSFDIQVIFSLSLCLCVSLSGIRFVLFVVHSHFQFVPSHVLSYLLFSFSVSRLLSSRFKFLSVSFSSCLSVSEKTLRRHRGSEVPE